MLPDDLDAQLVKASAQALRYTPGKLACFSEWSKQVQARLRELLRADLWPTSALKISVLSREDGDGFMREKIDFSGHPLFSGSAYVLVPNHRKGRVPGVLCLHGHGGYFAGKDMVAGVTGTHPIALECAAALNYGYGVQLARAGCDALSGRL